MTWVKAEDGFSRLLRMGFVFTERLNGCERLGTAGDGWGHNTISQGMSIVAPGPQPSNTTVKRKTVLCPQWW